MRRSRLGLSGSLAATAILVTGCGGAVALPPRPHAAHHTTARTGVAPPPSQGSTSVTVGGSTGGSGTTDPRLAACISELVRLGVPALPTTMTPTSNWPTVTLAASTSGGAFVPSDDDASAIETATWNLLSSSVGLDLTPYFGRTLTVVSGANPGGETCLEDGTKVVGAYDVVFSNSRQPLTYASVLGRSVADLTGMDYLDWLEKTGVYVPRSTTLTPGMTALQSLQDFFDTLNSQPAAKEDTALEEAFFGSTSSPAPPTFFTEFTFWVPLRITADSCPGATSSAREATYFVQLWPDYASQPLLAGNGFTAEFITLERADTSSTWRIAGMGTGC